MKTRTELYAYKMPKRSRFLTFLLALTLTFLVGTWLVQHTILDDVFVQHQLQDSKSYQDFTDQFNKTINAQAEQSGIPSSTLKDMVSETVQAKFQTYIADQAQPYANQMVSLMGTLESVAHIVMIVSGILSLLLAAIIVYRSQGHVQGWRYLFWGIFWAGLFVAFPGILLRFSDLIVTIAQNANSYSSIILTLISSILMVFVRVGAIVAVLGLLGVLICIVLPSFGKHKEKGRY